jgi:hypothetical protein
MSEFWTDESYEGYPPDFFDAKAHAAQYQCLSCPRQAVITGHWLVENDPSNPNSGMVPWCAEHLSTTHGIGLRGVSWQLFDEDDDLFTVNSIKIYRGVKLWSS